MVKQGRKDVEQILRGKTPEIGETSTGDCLSNLAKFTIMNFIITHSALSLSLIYAALCLCFAGVFIHDPLRVFVRDLQVKAS